ncbi:hypothetical protein D3C71_937470 [compost metagenome]
MGRTLNRFDEQALVALLIDRADVAAIDLQVRQPEPCQVADHAEATAKMLQAQGEPELTQTSRQVFEHRLVGQLFFADFQGQPRSKIGVRAQQFKNRIQRLRVFQGCRRQVQRQGRFVVGHLLQHQLQHQAIQPRRPVEPLQPRQEAPGRNALALVVDQP